MPYTPEAAYNYGGIRAELERRLSALVTRMGPYAPDAVVLVCAPTVPGSPEAAHGAWWATTPFESPVWATGFGDTEEAAFAALWANAVRHRRELAALRRKEFTDAEAEWAEKRERLRAWVAEGDAYLAEIKAVDRAMMEAGDG